MKISLDYKRGNTKMQMKNKYMELYISIREDILNGKYAYMDKLPSKRILAEENGVSVITVMHALEILEDEGYIEARERSGYFVIYSKSDSYLFSENKDMRLPQSRVSTSNVDENAAISDDPFPFSVYAKTLRSILSSEGDKVFEKSPNYGLLELRTAIAKYLNKNRGMYVEPEQIVVGSGAEYLYGLVIQLLGRTRIYALEDPSYDKIYKVYKANGAKCEFLKMGENGILTSELLKASASVLHVTPFNSFPSGITADASKRMEYVNWARQNKAFIVEDDFESEFTVSMKTADTLYSLDPSSVIYINTFSQTVAPSIRAGFMVVPKNLFSKFEEKVGFYSCTVPVLEQLVLAKLISDGDFERHINRVRRKRRKNG